MLIHYIEVCRCCVCIGGTLRLDNTQILYRVSIDSTFMSVDNAQMPYSVSIDSTFMSVENAQMPYSASVSIDGTNYGVGYGSSKKMAKSEAGKTSH